MTLTDEQLKAMWRSVQGPHAELNGPLIRFAGLVAKAVAQQAESDKNWLRAQRDMAEQWRYHDEPCTVCQIKRAAHTGQAHEFSVAGRIHTCPICGPECSC